MNSRKAGYEAERRARKLLAERGFTDIVRRSSGERGDDIKATSPEGVRYSVEVKCRSSIQPEDFWRQCRDNAATAKRKPMLMIRPKGRNCGTGQWWVLRAVNGKMRWELW